MNLFKKIAFLFAFLSLQAMAQQYNFRNYSVKEGVAQSQVYSVLQDSRGYLWMGTRGGGITRFDGMGFKTFTIKDGLINNYVFCIKEDARHNLWIGTNNGLSNYNGIQFKNYSLAGDSAQVWVQDLDIDKKGRLWLATNIGVMMMDGNKFVNITKLLKRTKTVINAIYVDAHQNIWYGDGNGLFRVQELSKGFTSRKVYINPGIIVNSITSIKQDNKGNLWVGTYGDGVYLYNGNEFSRIGNNEDLNSQTVLDTYFDNHDNALIATLSKGVCIYNTVAKSFTWLSENEGLSNNHVRSIIQDKSGEYWFGTSGGGICNYSGKQFTHYDKSSGLGGNFIYSIFRDSHNRLWVGTSDKGLSMFDSSRFVNFNAGNGFADVKVKVINEDNYGTLYFGTDGQGLYEFNGAEFKLSDGLGKKYIRAIIKDKDGNMWVATAGTGIYKIVTDPLQKNVLNFNTREGLLHNRITCLHYDKTGGLWYGTENNGIGLIKDEKVQNINISTASGLPSNSIRSLSEDKSGYLWVGTAGNGIAEFPIYQGDYKVKSFDHNSGLTSSNIYLLCPDENNNLFVGSETGLDYLRLDRDRSPSEIKHYGKGEGFVGIETCQNAVYKDTSGIIWFGTINGLSRYNPANLVKNENPPVISITDVRLFYESVAGTKYKKFAGDWNKLSGLSLPYNQNHLTFDFVGINFSNPEAVKYKWKLEGFEENWSPSSAQRTVTYSNIGPGNYTFMVKACNEDGIWNEKPVLLKFHIAKPMWMEWWFIISLIIAGAVLVVSLFKWRVNSIKAKAAEEQSKLQMEKDIVELEQKALRLQMNPHFIFNALNSIQSQIGTDNEQAARYYLAKFSRLMRQILDNSRNTSISLEEEVNTLENYLLIEKFCNGDRFDYKISVDENIEKDYIKIPPMILQPFVENAIKHGMKLMDEKRGLIEVNFKERNNLLECSVKDNGIGRRKAEELVKASKETYHKSTALAVTQERLELMGGDNETNSFEIIDLYDKSGNPCGTQVIVRIPLT